MKSFLSFLKKEWIETLRSGKFTILIILFLLFGIMNPAMAKLTPWIMEQLADSLAETGMIVTGVQVDALTSWTQFFKNIPVGFIVFIIMYSGIFTREYQSGTLLLVLTKGLARYKVVLAKLTMMLLLWTFCYSLCFTITYVYNAYFWDNSIVGNLFYATSNWWLFGVWVISLMVLFSVVFRNSAGVLLGTGGTVLAAYLVGLFPKTQEYTPAMLMNTASLLFCTASQDLYTKAVLVTIFLCVVCVVISIPVMKKKPI